MTHHLIVVEVPLLDASVLDRDLTFQRSGQAVHDSAFHLCLNRVGIDDPSSVHGAYNLVHFYTALPIDGHFGDLREDAAERFHHGNATAAPGW